MKRFSVFIGLSLTLLFSAAFAQNILQKAPVPATAGFSKAKTTLTSNDSKKHSNRPSQKTEAFLKLEQVRTFASPDPDKALVKLIVGTVWEDGTGYQILLDKEHKIYNDYNPEEALDPERYDSLYDDADITIPTGAVPIWDAGTSVLDNEQDSALIEPGTYDMLVLNPSIPTGGAEGTKVYVASGQWAALDDFEFEAGEVYVFKVVFADPYDNVLLIPPFDLRLARIILPSSGCQMTDLEVKFELENNSSKQVSDHKIEAFYTYGDAADTTREEFTVTLAPGAKQVFTFTEKPEIPDNEAVLIHTGISKGDEEGLPDNNYAQGVVFKHDPVDLPHTFDIVNYEMLPENPDAWEIDPEEGFALSLMDESPLVSMCFNMESGKKYRVSYDYMAGYDLWGLVQAPSSYSAGFGKTDEPFDQWDVVYTNEEAFSVYEFTSHEIILEPEETGVYAIYFLSNVSDAGVGTFAVKDVSVSELADYDVRMNAFTSGPRLMPVEHVNTKLSANVTIENRGLQAIEKAIVTISADGTEAGEKEIALGASGTVKTESIDFTLSGAKVGDKVALTAKVDISGQTDNNPDNELTSVLEVSQDVMAYDNVTEDMYTDDYSIGSDGTIGCGLPFTLASKDTLTAVSIGWAEIEADMEIKIMVHQWDASAGALGDLVFETSTRRGTEAGQREYELPALLLDAGSYMISLVQTGYGLITDMSAEGFLYITTLDPVQIQTGLGFPSIRAVFGQSGKPMAKDILVSEISKPRNEGLFSANEPIVIKLANLGHEKATVPVNVLINETALEPKTIDIEGYGHAEVTFTADLSEPDASYLITAFSSLAEDENRANDTCKKTVHCMPPADPYIMDFEYTEDFAIEGFNPAWTTVDGDAATIYGIQGVTFPHYDEAFAFIAFNPSTTTPPFTGEAYNLIAPHNGSRFGASFCSSSGTNDDWLISPKLKLPAKDAQMSFFVKSYTDQYGLEQFNVLISGTDNNPESFVAIGTTREAPTDEWEEVIIDLNEYAGKDVYVAIQCVSEDAFIFMVDDIKISKPAGNEGNNVDTKLMLYPNPAKEMITINAADAQINQVSVYNATGVLMYSSEPGLKTGQFRFNTSHLGSGFYFARILTDQGVAVMKFVVR